MKQYRKKCDCSERFDVEINTLNEFEKFMTFFLCKVNCGMFEEIPVAKPYYTWNHLQYFANKWYKCTVCKCVWEFLYPDFPAKGHVRRIEI